MFVFVHKGMKSFYYKPTESKFTKWESVSIVCNNISPAFLFKLFFAEEEEMRKFIGNVNETLCFIDDYLSVPENREGKNLILSFEKKTLNFLSTFAKDSVSLLLLLKLPCIVIPMVF